MERRTLYEDDLTEEREPSPAKREDIAQSTILDPGEPSPEDDDGALDDVDDEKVEDEDDETVDD